MGGPQLVILVFTNEENITEIRKKCNATGPQISV